MQRALLALVLGAVAGAATTYFAISSHTVPAHDADAGVASPTSAPEPRKRQADSAPSATAARAALYREAADTGGPELARLISDAAALPQSQARSYRLSVLLARYVELDAERAVATARELGMDADTLAQLYAQWAAADPAGALAALGEVENPAAATAIGLAMLAALGGDEYALQQVLAALPRAAENDLRVGAIVELAASDPAAALDRALGLDDFGATSLALERIGTSWARRNPRAALDGAEAIDDGDLRTPFQNAVLRTWAQVDSNGLVDYVLALDPEAQQRIAGMAGFFDVAKLDPERMLAVSGRFSSSVRAALERTALEALARQNPEAALERAGTLLAGPQQQFTRQTIARAYGKKDPDAALAWARASGDRDALHGVLGGIAVKNPNRALDLAASLPTQDQSNAYTQVISGAMSNREADFAGLAERLLSVGDGRVALNGMSNLVSSWMTRSPQSALDWVMTNTARVPPVAFQTAARYLAQNDPAAADQRLAQIPTEGRAAWLQGVAQGYAQSDPKAGAAWVERLRGDPAYGMAAGTIAQSLARTDLPAAAALLDGVAERGGVGAQTLTMAAQNVAASWARTNPLAAAEWARSFATDERSVEALGAVTQTWSGSDYAAARAWTLRMPSGAARDAALRPLLAAGGNGVDTSLLASFSADLPRQQAVVNAALQVASRDPKEARALVDRYVTRPELREQANQTIDLVASRNGGILY